MHEITFIDVWRYIQISLRQVSLRDAMVVVIVSTLTIGVFLGVVHVMGPGKPSQAESSPQTAETKATADKAASPS